jgi:hypothetical protein
MDEKNPHNFSEVTIEWLGNWLSGGGDASFVPDEVIAELNRPEFKPRVTSVRLFRGLHPKDNVEGNILTTTRFSAWTYAEKMAHNFGKKVVTTTARLSQILVDTTRLDPYFIEYECSGFPDEKEVILYPGQYEIDYVA